MYQAFDPQYTSLIQEVLIMSILDQTNHIIRELELVNH